MSRRRKRRIDISDLRCRAISHLPAQPLNDWMVEVRNEEFLEGNLDEVPKALLGPFGLTEIAGRLHGLVSPQVAVGDEAEPMLLRPLCMLTERAPPFHVLAVGAGAAPRQEEQGPLAGGVRTGSV